MLGSFSQQPNLAIALSENSNLRARLHSIWQEERIWPEHEALKPFALHRLGVKPSEYDDWYRRAWWGHYASGILHPLVATGSQLEKVLAIVEEPFFPAGMIETAVAAGAGVILLTSHLGPGYVPAYVIRKLGYNLKRITLMPQFFRRPEEADEHIYVGSDAERKVSLLRAIKHLSSGGFIAASPTGRVGNSFLEINFLGQKLKVYLGIAQLARLSGAPVFWTSCTWTNQFRLRLILEPIDIPSSDEAIWNRQFYEAYYRKLSKQMIQRPADLGFRGDFWDDLNWYDQPLEASGSVERG